MARTRRADTADRLKQTAMQLVLERGYGGTTIADIEAGAGLAPRWGTFYRHFESKEALLVAIGEEIGAGRAVSARPSAVDSSASMAAAAIGARPASRANAAGSRIAFSVSAAVGFVSLFGLLGTSEALVKPRTPHPTS